MFLKLSVPILTTLISSIANSHEQIGEQNCGFNGPPYGSECQEVFTGVFWETLGLPMTSEVSGRYRTRDLAGIWWIHG